MIINFKKILKCKKRTNRHYICLMVVSQPTRYEEIVYHHHFGNHCHHAGNRAETERHTNGTDTRRVVRGRRVFHSIDARRRLLVEELRRHPARLAHSHCHRTQPIGTDRTHQHQNSKGRMENNAERAVPIDRYKCRMDTREGERQSGTDR